MSDDYEGLDRSFARACREADRRARQRKPDPRTTRLCEIIADESFTLERMWDTINREARERYNGAPQSTYEAALYELRTHGLPQLKKASCQRRLGDLSTKRLRDLIAVLLRLQSQHPNITDELIAALGDQL
jgi:hypothetical protein